MIEFEIELRPHVGKYHSPRLGTRSIEHPQWMLFYHDAEMEQARGTYWLQIGYVGHTTNSIEFLQHAAGLGKEIIDEICRRVERMTGRPRVPHVPPSANTKFRGAAVKELDADD